MRLKDNHYKVVCASVTVHQEEDVSISEEEIENDISKPEDSIIPLNNESDN